MARKPVDPTVEKPKRKWKPTGNPMGRPPTDIPMDIVETACQFDANSNQLLQLLERKGIIISENTLTAFFKRKFGMTFLEYKDKRFDHTKLMLKQKAMKMAFDGNATMLIFCLKNLCKWTDKVEMSGNAEAPITAQVHIMLPDNGRSAPLENDT